MSRSSSFQSLRSRLRRWGRQLLAWQRHPEVVRRYSLTTVGAITLVIILVIGYAAVNSGANLVYYLFAFLIAGFLTHGIVSPRNLDGLVVRRLLPRRVVAGRPTEVVFHVRNKRRIWGAYALQIEDLAAPRRAVGFAGLPYVAARSETKVSYPTIHPVFQRRGLVVLREIIVKSRFPFGFIERSLHFSQHAELLVLPPVYPLSEELLPELADMGEVASRRRGTGSDLYALRAYIDGEPARRIHWRTSARSQRLIVADYEHEELEQILIYLPTCVPQLTPLLGEAFEHAVIVAASFAAFLLEKGCQVGLVTDQGFIQPESGSAQLELLLRALALVHLSEKGKAPHIEPQYRVVGVRYSEKTPPANALQFTWEDAREWVIAGNILRRTKTS